MNPNELQVPSSTVSMLRAGLRDLVYEAMAVPADHLVCVDYDYQMDEVVIKIVRKVGLDTVLENVYN